MATDAQAAQQPRLGLTHADDAFDRIARLVRRQLHVSIATVALITPDGLVLPGALGMPEPYQTTRRIPGHRTLTHKVVESRSPIVLQDVRTDPEAAAVCALFGAGEGSVVVLPVHAADDVAVGALVAMDVAPRVWTGADLATLADLAASCSGEIRLRTERERARQAERSARREQRRSQLLLSLSEAFAGSTTAAQVERALRGVVARGMGASATYLALVDGDGRGVTFVTAVPDLAPQAAGGGGTSKPLWARTTADLPVCEVARTGTPLFFAGSAELLARYPALTGLLRYDGACSILPVHADGRVAAIVCTRWDAPRAHDADTTSLEATLMPYVAHALDRVALLEARREVATTLQEALLTAPPAVAHLDIATTYEPATRTDQVGGDWYDVVAVDDDTTLLMIGDVTGHDMQAAAHMGQLRSMLRALAWSHDETPSVLLTLLDRANHQLGPRAGATAVVVRLERLPIVGEHAHMPGTYAVTWSNAGHPPPLVLRQDGSVEVLRPRSDLLLGVVPAVERTDHATVLRPGETLLLYTDGLVEARGTMLADRIDLLARTLRRSASTATASLPAALVRALVPVAPQRDDVAVLAVRARVAAAPVLDTPPAPSSGSVPSTQAAASPSAAAPGDASSVVRAERRVADSLAELGPARRWIDDILETSGVGQRARRTAMLLSSELLTNALEHGGGPVTAMVEVDAQTSLVRVGVRDASRDRPLLRHPEPHELSGRGVQFLERLAARWGVVDHTGTEAVGRHGHDLTGKTVWFELRPGTVSGAERSV
ncbi:protein serine phosphatase with GAF(s) sensor(s) [Xylanimonas cellulosilytica DSM 15894]|uniref:Protein serine phosphatase with GAF(S) sensor(S) n=1 Tax=Xylanimonas cellulosilytica (strain DSM 15894 / JCM 12276 / CECT 5975 / KCTC 9989 / LMG 20990 / NBRC 107835 / XIL07) TaxID=446471 RepID=D1BRL2_XYLCX|nr:SpoIIE family protein phosphatase [Xylanimonas cellulosilytica]ACZ32278.1 protein serine phosphatase with GAF(s) sensor(s) [Xylanimonas cellulosilytica DSM 15894]